MTREETIKLLQIIQAAFPKWEVTDKTGLIDVWTNVCADDDFNALQVGLRNYIVNDTSGFAPSIGQIRNGVKQVAEQGDDTEEMIGLLRKAIKNGNYGYTEEYALLPPTLQKAIGCAENIRAWAAQPKEQFESITLSAVRRAYRATKEHEENVRSVLPVTEHLIEQGKQNVVELETPKAVPQIETLPTPEPQKEPEPELMDEETKEAIVEIWNSEKGRQTIGTFHFKAPSYRDAVLETLKMVDLKTLLYELRDSKEELFLAALGVIRDVHS